LGLRVVEVGADAYQPDFINAVAALDTDLSAQKLLRALQGIEQEHRRQRSFANAPRTLDLDLLLYGKEAIATTELMLPHPRMHERAFVLQPLLEIAPHLAFDLDACKGQRVERIA
jgi:2-amino-4-hydroxy-6-hydroxymethyldihydropteridine diphosphokinase